MAKRRGNGTRRITIFERVWSPFKHALMFGENSGQKIGTTAGKVVKEGVGAVRKIGNSLAKHTDQAATNLFKKGRKQRGGSRKKTMKTRRGGSRRRAGTCRRGRC